MKKVSTRRPAHKGKAAGPEKANPRADKGRIDWREQTFNAGAVGPVEQVSTPAELITSLRTVMIDVDPKDLAGDLYDAGEGTFATRLYQQSVRHWLDRHPLLAHSEVRHTGSGLHVLIHLDPAVEFGTPADRARWAAVVRVLQSLLPSDPNAPGLTALTRPLGSTNSKNDRTVKQLRPGTPVAPDDVLGFVDEVRRRPFATVARILYGTDRITPCPSCRTDGSTLGVLDRVGRCYARCGTVKLARLYGPLLADPLTKEGA